MRQRYDASESVFWTWWPMFILGLIAFQVGAEIRVRADRLLAERFEGAFIVYRLRVPTYLSFIR